MKKISLLIVLSIIANLCVLSQKASDVIENGIKIKEGREAFIKFDGTNILYHINSAPNDLHFKQIEDSAMLLPVDGSVIFYMRPLNPLNYSYKSETKIIVDPISEQEATALAAIRELPLHGLKPAKAGAESDPFCNEFAKHVVEHDALVTLLKDDKKGGIKTIFSDLKKLSFDKEDDTKDGVVKGEAAIAVLKKHYSDIETRIKTLKAEVEKTECADKVENFIMKRVFADALNDLDEVFANQKKRLTNLDKVFKLVKSAYDEAARISWLVKLAEVPATKGKIAIFTVTINEAGYKLSDNDEITEAGTKEKAMKVVRLRRFQRFVPEVSVGVAYANLSFPKYSTNDDGSGNQVVTAAGEDKINKVNFTSMINYTLFLTHSPIHPFWQLGIGVNADFPTLLTGVGIRVNAAGAKRLALSFGIATTWIKTLNKLKVGDVVKGPADVENDTKYEFNTKPKPYFGLQYNF